jgi:hypothetical protein
MKLEMQWTLTEWGMGECPSEWIRLKGLMQFDLGSKKLEEKIQTGWWMLKVKKCLLM